MNNVSNIATIPVRQKSEDQIAAAGADRAVLAPTFDRLRAEWRLKLFLLVTLNLWVYGPYLLLQHHHFFPAFRMPETFFDRLIPFSDRTVWLYLSIDVLVPIGPFLMNRRQQLLRYALGIALIGAAADFAFIFWPTCCGRPPIGGTNAVYQLLVSIDNPYHAFPSLHAAFAIYSALCGVMVLREIPGSPAKAGIPYLRNTALWLWAFLILYGTLATKQHMAWDIVGGSVLGLAAYLLVFGLRQPQASINS